MEINFIEANIEGEKYVVQPLKWKPQALRMLGISNGRNRIYLLWTNNNIEIVFQ